ncbi:MAG: hypothetical protein QXL16_01145 [Candidatus Micrarchaeaceae archaeon]
MLVKTNILFLVTFLAVSVILIYIVFSVQISYILKFILGLLAIGFDLLAYFSRFYSYILFPLFKSRSRRIVLNDSEIFTMHSSNKAIVCRLGGGIYASAFVKVPIYRSATEMSDEEKIEFSKVFGRILSLSSTPIKLSSHVFMIDKDEYINKIRDKLSEAEIKFTELSNDPNAPKEEIERLKGMMAMWQNVLFHFTRSDSNALVAYVTVSSEGATEEEAANLALIKAEEISAGISSLLGVPAEIAEGKEILKLIEPEYIIPYVTVSEKYKEKVVEQGL